MIDTISIPDFNTGLIILLGVVFFMLGVFLIGYLTERKYYNKGICPKCGEKLEFFDRDSQGGRGYKCPKCKYITWVSYSLVDELY